MLGIELLEKASLLRFLTGGKRTAEESVGQVYVADDSTSVIPKMKRCFNEMANIGQWATRDWLVSDGTSQTMFCALCRKHASDDTSVAL